VTQGEPFEEAADIVVIGAGAMGITAAIAAREAGALLLNRTRIRKRIAAVTW
jgi:thioredoxin reductase